MPENPRIDTKKSGSNKYKVVHGCGLCPEGCVHMQKIGGKINKTRIDLNPCNLIIDDSSSQLIYCGARGWSIPNE